MKWWKKGLLGIALVLASCLLMMKIDSARIMNKQEMLFCFFMDYYPNTTKNVYFQLGPLYYVECESNGLGYGKTKDCHRVKIGFWFMPTKTLFCRDFKHYSSRDIIKKWHGKLSDLA